MRVFFSLSRHFMQSPEYEASVRNMARHFNLEPVFAHECPAGAAAEDWIAARIAECQFAFFDLTGLDADVLFACGIASQGDDAIVLGLVDRVEHDRLRPAAGPLAARLLGDAKAFNRADDFQRQAQMFISSKIGPTQLLDGAFIARIKEGIRNKGPIYMRQLAAEIGRPMPEIQPVVYELVRKGEVKKISDKRWTRYSA